MNEKKKKQMNLQTPRGKRPGFIPVNELTGATVGVGVPGLLVKN